MALKQTLKIRNKEARTVGDWNYRSRKRLGVRARLGSARVSSGPGSASCLCPGASSTAKLLPSVEPPSRAEHQAAAPYRSSLNLQNNKFQGNTAEAD